MSNMPLTYPEVGATAGPPPPGYRHLGFVTQIGAGHQRFEEAADAVMHWGMQRGAGLRVQPSSDAVEVGAVVLVKMGFLKAPCRVVYVIDQPDVRGFAYGTLPGHPESGEERFVVRHDPVTAAVYAGLGVLPAHDLVEQSRRPVNGAGPAGDRQTLHPRV